MDYETPIDPEYQPKNWPAALKDFFWTKVRRSDGCWEWQGGMTGGYGVIAVAKFVNCPAHRVAYALTFGPIPRGREIHHRCRNTRCVRPDHLRALTPTEHGQHRMKPAEVNGDRKGWGEGPRIRRITVDLSYELHTWLKIAAAERETTLQDLVRGLIEHERADTEQSAAD